MLYSTTYKLKTFEVHFSIFKLLKSMKKINESYTAFNIHNDHWKLCA